MIVEKITIMNKLLPLLIMLISIQAWSQCEIAQQQITLSTDECWTLTPPNNINQSITAISNGQLRMIPRGNAQLAVLPRVYNGAGTLSFDITGLGSWQVGVMSSPSNGGSFIQIASGTVNSSVFSPRTINFAPLQGHQYEYVAIIGSSGPYSNPNITIENLVYTSGCPATEFPVFNLNSNVIVELDASGNATVSTADFDNGSITACGNALDGLSLDVTSFTCADIGSNQLTLSAQYNSNTIGSTPVTLTVEDNLAPIAVGQNLTVMVNSVTGVGTITPAQVDNGSSDNCGTGSLTYSLSKTIFTCEDTGDNVVTLTVQDASGNTDQVDVTVTVQSDVNDQIVSASNINICPDGTSGSTISTDGSIVGFNYTLRRSSDNTIIDGPTAGTGSALNFNTGNISENTTFNILAEKMLSTTQSALDFDGMNDHVNLTADNRSITTELTVASWVKTSGTEADVITGKYNGINGFIMVMNVDGKVSIDGRDGVGGYKTSGISSTSINDNEWHYVTGTINLTSGEWKIYIDGVLENSTTQAAGTTLASNANFNIAAQAALAFPARFDQLTIWNDELDANAIFTNFTSCLTGSETNVVGHFSFDDGSGTTLSDHSSTNIDGTLTNMDGSTDWIQEVSPSCGDKMCNYQLSTEITIGDITPPTAIAQNIIAPIDLLTGLATISAADINNGSSDNCASNLNLSISQTSFSCGDLGDNTVTLTVEDEEGNQATATATVTVTLAIQDRTVSASDPVSCADGSSATIEVASSETGIDYFLRNSADNNVVSGPVAGTGGIISFNSGPISSAQTFNVFGQSAQIASNALDFDGVNDLVFASVNPALDYSNGYTIEAWVFAPAIGSSHLPILSVGNTTTSDIEIYIQAGTSDLIVSHDRGEANSGGFGFSDPPANQWFHLAVTYDGTNIKAFYNGVQQAVVQSSFAPPGPMVKTNGLLLKVGEVSHTAFGAGGAFFNGQVDEVRVWDYARTSIEITSQSDECLNGSESGLSAYYNFDEGSGTSAVDLAGGNNGTLLNMDASDWVSGAITCLSCGVQMSTEITLGQDNVNPSAQAQNLTVQLDASGDATISVSDVNDGSSDDCTSAGNLILSLDKSSFTCADLGMNTVNLTVEDASGNQSTASATITVEDQITPTVNTQNITVQLDALNGNASITTTQIDNGSSDNCTSTSNLQYSLDKMMFSCSDLGQNTVTLTVTDESGNQGTGTATVTVEDNTLPTRTLQNITLQLGANGEVSYSPSDLDNGSTDNCGPLIFTTNDPTTLSCSNLGANNVTIFVSDPSGNQTSGTATITVVDGLAPSVNTQNITAQLDNSGNVSITATDINDGSSDNCTSQGSLILSLDQTAFTTADIGTNTVTLSVEDASGNIGTGTATVTVVEKTPQTITFTTITDKTYGDGSFGMSASSDSGLPVSFSITSGPVSLNGSTLTITGAGDVTVEALQPGDATYAPAVESQTFTINKADLTVTADNQSIDFGETIPALTFQYSGFIDGENASDLIAEPSISTTATNASDAGTYPINLSGGSSPNYSFNLVDGTMTINKIDQTISVNPIADKRITDTPFNVEASTTSSLALTYSVTGPATILGNTVTLSGQEGEVTVQVSQPGNINYNAASSSISFEVIDPNQVISFSAISDMTYGDPSINLAATSSSGLPVAYTVLDGPASVTGNTLTIFAVGTVMVAADQSGDALFFPAQRVTQVFEVNKASLTVTATNETITYGNALPTLTFGYSGFVNSEDASVLTEVPSVSTNAAQGADAGVYDIIVSGGMAQNYAVNHVNGMLTINKANQAITITPIDDKLPDDPAFDVIASVDSGLPLTYSVTGPATISASTITLNGTEGMVEVTVSQAGTTNYNAASEKISFEVKLPLTVGDDLDLSVYPNPSSDFIYFDSAKEITVFIYSLNGKLIKKNVIRNSGMDIRDLKQGMYLLKIDSGSDEPISQLIKKN